MNQALQLAFAEPDILGRIVELNDAELDRLDFGVIGFDSESIVRRYNAFETKWAGLALNRVVGYPLFTIVAPMHEQLPCRATFRRRDSVGCRSGCGDRLRSYPAHASGKGENAAACLATPKAALRTRFRP